MGEDNRSREELGCLGIVAGLAGLVATFTLGPIDFTRTVYNQIIGDMPVLKRQLVDYCRDAVRGGYSMELKTKAEVDTLDTAVETVLAEHLDAPYKGEGKINPSDVSIERLWDYIEEHPKSLFDRWIWP